MPSPLSVDLRQRVVAAISGGTSCHQAAARFRVSVASASRWSTRHQLEGHVTPKPSGGDRNLKPGGRLVVVDSLQRGDRADYDGLLELFPQNFHEPYYSSYIEEDFRAMAQACGLVHVRDVSAFVSKVMVFDKPI